MKHLLKLLKDWTDPSGTEFKAGEIIELDESAKALVGELIVDGIAEKATKEAIQEAKDLESKDISAVVNKAVKDAVKDLPSQAAKELHDISVKERSDSDMSFGYLMPTAGREHTRDEKTYGLGLFAKDVYAASKGNGEPSRLKILREKSAAMIKKGMEAGYIDKAAASGGMVVDIDSDGGFLIPPEFSTMLLEMQNIESIVRPRATKLDISSDTIELPQWKDYDHSGNTVFGGARAYFKGENASLTASKPTLEDIKLTLNALTGLAYASHKLMTFSPTTVGSFILPSITSAMAWKEDQAFILGTGAGMPLGVLTTGAKVSVSGETGQDTDTVVTENITKMFARARVRSNASTVWLYNKPELLDMLLRLKLEVGTGGSAAGLITQITGSPNMNMLGYPLVDSEQMSALGDAGCIALVDLSEYLIADCRKGPEVAQSMHLQFDTGQEAFRIIKYVDGQPRYSDTFTRAHGSNDTSPIVSLAAI